MDIQNLYYLLEVEKCRSINKASSCCFLSSQQLSRIVRQIEKEYAVTIFERTNLGLKPTKQGLQFLEEVKAREEAARPPEEKTSDPGQT